MTAKQQTAARTEARVEELTDEQLEGVSGGLKNSVGDHGSSTKPREALANQDKLTGKNRQSSGLLEPPY
ncbi:MAG: hypothetical protein AAGA95_11295 [Pseudomonadota bacterium]